jgi:prolyl-tRNA editing enzyme YbaK/EbsC (Cys-tRNA(Pro) deacylase)
MDPSRVRIVTWRTLLSPGERARNGGVHFPIGVVSPIGSDTPLRAFVDPDLLQYDEVWASAGTWHDVFALTPADLVRASGALVTDLKR